MKMIALYIIAFLFFAYCILLFVAFFFAESLMFHPPKRTKKDFTDEIVTIETPQKNKISAAYLENKKAKYCILYSHGNGEDVLEIMPELKAFLAKGVSLFAYDYVGYGSNTQKPKEKFLNDCADAAWEFVSQSYAPENIVICGFSLGSVPSAYLAQKHPDARCLVIFGGISKGVLTILPFDIIPWKILDNASKMEQIKIPTILIHGTRDMIVPFRNAKRNYNLLQAPKSAIWFTDLGHNVLRSDSKYWGKIEKFIRNPKDESGTVDYF